jgi:hypothetical protein
MTVSVVIDDTDLIEAEAIRAIFIEVVPGVVDEKLAYAIRAEVEYVAARPPLVGKEQRVPEERRIVGRAFLAIVKPQALRAEVSTSVVEHQVEDHGESVDVTNVHQCLELIRLAAKVLLSIRAQAAAAELSRRGWPGKGFCRSRRETCPQPEDSAARRTRPREVDKSRSQESVG